MVQRVYARAMVQGLGRFNLDECSTFGRVFGLEKFVRMDLPIEEVICGTNES